MLNVRMMQSRPMIYDDGTRQRGSLKQAYWNSVRQYLNRLVLSYDDAKDQ